MAFPIPQDVKRAARLGLALRERGYQGGTATGWGRAHQLIRNERLDLHTLSVMRAWYARHGPDAKNGGTSYQGYLKWVNDGRPRDGRGVNKYRGAVAWLIWGGDAAYRWLKTEPIRAALAQAFPKKRKSSTRNNLRGAGRRQPPRRSLRRLRRSSRRVGKGLRH